MDYKDKNTIFKRFNAATYDMALAEIALRKDDNDLFTKHIRDAGEAISQSIEYALKNHLDKVLSNEDRRFFNLNRENIVGLIEKYVDENGSDNGYLFSTIDDTIEPNVDFLFLKKEKKQITNAAKHEGKEPNFDIQKKYLEEVRKFINQYIDDAVLLKRIQDYEQVDLSTWNLLYTVCDRFLVEERNYILVIGKNQNVNYLKNLAIPKWTLIIDFDFNSINNGLFSTAFKEKTPPPHVIKSSDLVDANTFSRFSQSHYHYFANSYFGSGDVEAKDFSDWNRKYGKKTELFLKSFAEVFPAQKNIVVILDANRRYVNFLCERMDQLLGSNTTYVFANDPNDELSQICDDFNGVKVNITIPEIADGFANVSSSFGVLDPNRGQRLIPFMEKSQTETSGILTESEFAQLEEYFEVIHKGLPELNENETSKKDFLTGEKKISWYGLKNRFDVENQKRNRKLLKSIEKVIENGRGKIYLVHEAGFGGTTVARRIAWEIHDDYPTLILKKYREGKVKEALIKLHEKTRKTILVVMEVPQSITLDEVESLYKSIPQSRPIVFLVVKRGKPSTNDLVVTDWGNDSVDLINAYKPYIKEHTSEEIRIKKEKEIDDILYSNESYKKTPFYIGLLTFEENFFALKDYIKNFIFEISEKEEQKKVLIY